MDNFGGRLALNFSNYTSLKRFTCLTWILKDFSTTIPLSQLNYHTLPVTPFKLIIEIFFLSRQFFNVGTTFLLPPLVMSIFQLPPPPPWKISYYYYLTSDIWLMTWSASKKYWTSNELFKMWSTFFVSLKMTEILNILTVLLIFNQLEFGQIFQYFRQFWR